MLTDVFKFALVAVVAVVAPLPLGVAVLVDQKLVLVPLRSYSLCFKIQGFLNRFHIYCLNLTYATVFRHCV